MATRARLEKTVNGQDAAARVALRTKMKKLWSIYITYMTSTTPGISLTRKKKSSKSPRWCESYKTQRPQVFFFFLFLYGKYISNNIDKPLLATGVRDNWHLENTAYARIRGTPPRCRWRTSRRETGAGNRPADKSAQAPKRPRRGPRTNQATSGGASLRTFGALQKGGPLLRTPETH